ncbi:hypothetical protein HAHE_18620 [Haloferula helveola]|uniref:Uncharacterized protein n=1 Tax=Haloferula helveola TaxID=490095 RepID=A0ABN6H5W4_9BACT|nr:hypothetical protein HAHE_18620 [Haloferula helveola]
MKSRFTPALAAILMALPAAHAQRFQQEAMLVFSDADYERVWIADANKASILYFETEQGVDSKKMSISEPQSIWLMEPPEYTEAMELYQGRKYEEAREKFATVREKYKKLITLPDNHSSLAAFYEMECLRKLGMLDELAEAEKTFLPDDRNSLTREHHLKQLDLYTMWEAVRVKEWPRLELMAKEWLEKNIPGYQRAQVGYCLGLSLEGQKRPIEAINAYNIGMTADTGASERITSESALNALRLYQEDETVKLAVKLYGTPDEDPDSSGMLKLREAASLASLYELTLGGGQPLPASAKGLLKYKDDSKPKPAPEKEEGEKPKEDPKKKKDK